MGCEEIKIIRNSTNPEEIDAQIITTTDPEKKLIPLGKPAHAKGRLRWLQIEASTGWFTLAACGVAFMVLGGYRIASGPEDLQTIAFGLADMLVGTTGGIITASIGVGEWKKINRIKQNLDAKIQKSVLEKI